MRRTQSASSKITIGLNHAIDINIDKMIIELNYSILITLKFRGNMFSLSKKDVLGIFQGHGSASGHVFVSIMGREM